MRKLLVSVRRPTRHWLRHTASLRRAGGVLAGHDEGNDKTVQTQSLGENEDEDHSDEKPRLLSGGAHTSVTNDANSHTGGEAGEAAGETTSKMSEAVVEGVLAFTDDDLGLGDHGNDQAVDTDHTSHDNGDDRAHDEVRAHHTHGGNADAGLSSAVGGAEVGEDQGCCSAHEAEEGGGGWACFCESGHGEGLASAAVPPC